MSILGLDIGTTGCKCTIFTETGITLSAAYIEYPVDTPAPGYYELNPLKVWNAVKTVIGSTAKAVAHDKPIALSISSFGEACVPIDKNGNILYSSILYMDERGSEQAARMEERLGRDKIMELTGVPCHSMYTINKVTWIKDHLPEIFNNTWKFLLYGDYISFMLTGQTYIDYSLASRTMALNVKTKKWESEIFNAAGIDMGYFSEPVPTAVTIGNIRGKIADELGLPKDLLVATGGHDQICAAVGGGITTCGNAIDGIGSVECITPVFNKPMLNRLMADGGYACVPHAIEGMYATYAFNFTGGSLLKWFRDNFAAAELDAARKSGKSVYSILDGKATGEPSGILVLPHFAGAGTPYMDTKAKGAVIGLDFSVTAGRLYRAMLEGITYEMLYNMDYLKKAGIEIHTLSAVGGGSKSELWLQIKADITGRKVIALEVEEAGTLGTAIFAGTAAGIYRSVNEAVSQLVKVRKEFYPDEKTHQIYLEYYEKYKKVYQSIKELIR